MIKQIIKQTLRYALALSAVVFVFALVVSPAHALTNNDIRIHLDDVTVKERGYTIDKPDGAMRLAIQPTVLPSAALVTLQRADNQSLPSPEGLRRVSDILEFDILTDPIKIFAKDVVIVLSFDSTNYYTKKIYFYDANQKAWRPLRSLTNYTDHWTRAYTHLPFSRIAVFEDRGSVEGYASWYRNYSYSHGAASNDFPIGSKVRVTNLDTGATTDVTIVSTGPFAPGRVIDLGHRAFQNLSPLWQGTIKVHVEPTSGSVLGTATTPGGTGTDQPAIMGRNGIIWDPAENRVLYEKNAGQSRPIASITKLMTAIVYIETNNSLTGTVTMASEDHADGVTIAVNPGDRLSVFDLYHAMLTGSANNAAKALARSTDLPLSEFVRRMNKRAHDIGLTNFNFLEPTGLDPADRASAADVAKLVQYALGRPVIRFATQRHDYTYSVTRSGGETEQRTIRNPMHIGSAVLLDEQNLLGGKTGYVNESGWCLGVVFRPANGRQYLAVTLGSDRVNRNLDIEKMMHWAYGR